MRQSELFTKTLKTDPKDEDAVNAKLLIRGGYIRKMSSGVYFYLPLALRVIEKISAVVREEMNAIGGQELLMPALIAKEYWQKSRRWHTDVAYELESPFGDEFALGWTHEEAISAVVAHFLNSYQDLPFSAYQIQTKFRAEPRAKSGLLRCREFIMKDLYSFHATKEDLDSFYQKVIGAYRKIFERLSLKARITEAAGGAFTEEYVHEFQVLASSGEDTIYYCAKCDFSQNKEIAHVQQGNLCPECDGEIQEGRGIEIGNVFKLGTRYSDAFDLKYTTKDGEKKPVIMGSYGIGITRALATLVEIFHDDKGIIWPEAAAPFKVHLLELGGEKSNAVKAQSEKIYKQLEKSGAEVLYDDRGVSAGEKLADADLIGIPWRAIVSEKTLRPGSGQAGKKVELKKRDSKIAKLLSAEEFLKKMTK